MACIVYRKGKGTWEHGIECESTTCEPGELGALLSSGWSQTPPGYVAPEVIETPEDPEDLDLEEAQDEVDRLNGEVQNLSEQIRLKDEIEQNLNATIETLKGDIVLLSKEKDDAVNEVDRLNLEVLNLKEALELHNSEEEEEPEEGQLSNDEVRQAAKDKGIEGWDTKRIATLRAALEA